jgi:broad specificity phosphatase PhoE
MRRIVSSFAATRNATIKDSRMGTLYVVRHAEPAVTGVFLGSRNDVPLKGAPPRFHFDVEVVYVSPLLRARQTAAGILAPQVVIDDLREIDFGEWGGLSWEEIETRWPETLANKRSWFGTSPPGGESWPAFVARVEGALKTVLKDPRPKAIVAHGAVNAVIGAALSGRSPALCRQRYAEVASFDIPATYNGNLLDQSPRHQ